jgi:PIN domain nuclease of toxin-antitoxin system
LIYLDTHVVVWLYAGLVENFSRPVRDLINENEMRISPIIRLELQYLYETQRITVEANVIVADLSNRLGLHVCDKLFNSIVDQAVLVKWTRDPFDRLIVGNAQLGQDILITKDRNIRQHYPHANW